MASAETVDDSMISVTLEDGSVVEYSQRGLKQDEIEPWAQFCASVFAYKANPPSPSYFERHFYNDPNHDASLIRVMLYDGKVVSSCRIFQRQVSGGDGTSVLSGGIGEVCTSLEHRKRGLSKLLLQNSIRIMTSRGMKLSLLHAAPAFFSVYERAGGYSCVTCQWSAVTILRSKLNERASPYTIRQATFPKDTARMQKIHEQYSERRFVGCIIRSDKAYWNDYISKELEGSLWTLAKQDDDEVIAWISLRQRGERQQMRDFGCDTNVIAVSEALSMLLKVALGDVADERVLLHLPTAVIGDMQESKPTFLDLDTLEADNDDGWMYKTLQPDQKSMADATTTRYHLIWPADSF